MNGADRERYWQRYLALREQANEDWQRVAQISALVAEQFMADSPHGGDLDALTRSFASATRKTRKALAHYRVWLTQQ